jgi:hypothetical protein
MTKFPFRFLGFAALLLAFASVGRAADMSAKIIPAGDNTYTVTISASHKFSLGTEKLKTRATEAASDYCAKLGKQLKIVSVKENKTLPLIGEMSSVTLTFKALDLSDKALSAAAPASATIEAAVPATNETLYADLLRLDDLRKKGILTEAEFAAEKKKLLDRSR